jgi:heme ABC exporter ATP-binding subunit CcmA
VVESRVLVVKGVTRSYCGAWVLRGINTRFEAGSITIIGGANGSGKTTLLGVVGGLIRPSEGVVTWESRGVVTGERAGAVGWVGHDSSCYRDLTAMENVALVATVHGVGESAVRRSLERVGIEALTGCRVGLLSRGQKQRVAIARGIVHSPDLLLLDEPFTGLDACGCVLLEAVLEQERERGAIVVVVSHDSGLAGRLSGRGLCLSRGKLGPEKRQ